ncbi:hypothetical protein PGIGA_G00011120 [Pangasianodon gigas]|uniref:Uncharacterized protein n=1 Tax=Pangasianodon gigas TaxID=30993 RepID=A0ACC5W736_PANGG|nr:hypothetical protein [Pangasianodon gigas]
MVVERIALPPHISRVRGSILSVMHALLVSAWVTYGISGFLPPPKNMLVGLLALYGALLAGSKRMSPSILSALPKGRLHQHPLPLWQL